MLVRCVIGNVVNEYGSAGWKSSLLLVACLMKPHKTIAECLVSQNRQSFLLTVATAGSLSRRCCGIPGLTYVSQVPVAPAK